MKLELADFPVKDVRFGKQTNYDNGILEINKEEIEALILNDKRIESADLDVALPGEQTRIVNIRDVVEPRVKVSGPGCVFPGILGPIETVGEGRTHRLSGTTIMASAEYRPTIPTGGGAQTTGIVDMWGPGASKTPFGSTINIVPIFKLRDEVTELEAHSAIQLAECRVAQRLAETTKSRTAENIEVFELSKVDPSLPRVVYILSFITYAEHGSTQPHSGVAFYGLSVRESLPTLVHPNELFDGALTTDARRGAGIRPQTWSYMNNPVVLSLYREHGKRLNFLGVILQRTRFVTEFGKRVTAACTSQMARLLRADGAVITRTSPSGNNMEDVMLTVQACERKGVKTVYLGPEWGGKDGLELPLVFYVPEATAMVSTGSMDRPLKLPAPAKVIGVREGQLITIGAARSQPLSPWDKLRLDSPDNLCEGNDYFGVMNYTCRAY